MKLASTAAPDAGEPTLKRVTSLSTAPASDTQGPSARHVRSLRLGHGANCSSVGSVVDTLFLGAAVGGAIFAAVCAAMRNEPARIVGGEVVRRGADALPDDAGGASDPGAAGDEEGAP